MLDNGPLRIEMTKLFLKIFLTFPLFLTCCLFGYEVRFEGSIPEDTLQLLNCASQLIALKESPPATQAGLRTRAEADVKNLLQVLHSQAYYNAQLNIDIDFERACPLVLVQIETGPVYPFASFTVEGVDECQYFNYDAVDIYEDLGISIGAAALPEVILKAEETLLFLMAQRGFPLATIEHEVLADQATQSIHVTLRVKSGPPAYFGPVTISGNCLVLSEYFSKKIAWAPNQLYDPRLVAQTQATLELSGLFSSVTIIRGETLDENQLLPIRIDVVEGKHRSIAWGLTYNTQRGPGVSFEWEHRNVRQLGERVRLNIDLWPDEHDVRLLHITPDYMQQRQDLLWLAEYHYESTKGYTESSISLSRMLERQISQTTRISYGAMYKWLQDSHSNRNGDYHLFKTPFYLRWSNADNLLDPTEGRTIHLKIIPSLQFVHPHFGYCINTLTATHYSPLTHDRTYVLASKLTLGSIFGSNKHNIPASERFYEGSETTLRGYRYQTVSPLRHCDKPIGGKSVLVYSLELRIRATECFGWTTFYDIGNVYADSVPQLDRKVLQSLGWGLRYHTPVGPIRIDFAVPLNRRKHLDPRFQIYLSIGQAF